MSRPLPKWLKTKERKRAAKVKRRFESHFELKVENVVLTTKGEKKEKRSRSEVHPAHAVLPRAASRKRKS